MGQHITNMAQSLIGELGIPQSYADSSVHHLWVMWVCKLEKKVHRMNPETLGSIVAQGKGIVAHCMHTPMYEVFEGHEATYSYIRSHDTGMQQLQHLACVALIAEIHDELRRRRMQVAS